MAATHSREYYRSLSDERLVTLAREEGINPEMAIAVVERLAVRSTQVDSSKLGFEFNFNGGTNA